MLPAGIFLMGYGLVAIPRLLWQSADIRGQQRILYARAGQQAEAAMTAHRYIPLPSQHAQNARKLGSDLPGHKIIPSVPFSTICAVGMCQLLR